MEKIDIEENFKLNELKNIEKIGICFIFNFRHIKGIDS